MTVQGLPARGLRGAIELGPEVLDDDGHHDDGHILVTWQAGGYGVSSPG